MVPPAFAFDTHKFVRKLKGAGFNEEQAEALTDAVRESQASADVATKADLRELGTELRHEIGDLRKDMDAKLAAMEERFNARVDKLGLQIVNKLGGLIVAGVVAIAAIPVLFKYLHVG